MPKIKNVIPAASFGCKLGVEGLNDAPLEKRNEMEMYHIIIDASLKIADASPLPKPSFVVEGILLGVFCAHCD